MGDFSGYTIQQCAKKSIKKAHVAGFIGKLTKIAMGVKQTHVKGSKVDMDFLAKIAQKCNATKDIMQEIKNANTARHVQEIIIKNKVDGFFTMVCKEACEQMRTHCENKVEIHVTLFDFDGCALGRYP
jgi:cobalt-precorrin-5B (C1)-methyltransferase